MVTSVVMASVMWRWGRAAMAVFIIVATFIVTAIVIVAVMDSTGGNHHGTDCCHCDRQERFLHSSALFQKLKKTAVPQETAAAI